MCIWRNIENGRGSLGGTWYATVISDLAQSVRKLLLVKLELRADFWVLSMEHSGIKWRGRAGNLVT